MFNRVSGYSHFFSPQARLPDWQQEFKRLLSNSSFTSELLLNQEGFKEYLYKSFQPNTGFGPEELKYIINYLGDNKIFVDPSNNALLANFRVQYGDSEQSPYFALSSSQSNLSALPVNMNVNQSTTRAPRKRTQPISSDSQQAIIERWKKASKTIDKSIVVRNKQKAQEALKPALDIINAQLASLGSQPLKITFLTSLIGLQNCTDQSFNPWKKAKRVQPQEDGSCSEFVRQIYDLRNLGLKDTAISSMLNTAGNMFDALKALYESRYVFAELQSSIGLDPNQTAAMLSRSGSGISISLLKLQKSTPTLSRVISYGMQPKHISGIVSGSGKNIDIVLEQLSQATALFDELNQHDIKYKHFSSIFAGAGKNFANALDQLRQHKDDFISLCKELGGIGHVCSMLNGAGNNLGLAIEQLNMHKDTLFRLNTNGIPIKNSSSMLNSSGRNIGANIEQLDQHHLLLLELRDAGILIDSSSHMLSGAGNNIGSAIQQLSSMRGVLFELRDASIEIKDLSSMLHSTSNNVGRWLLNNLSVIREIINSEGIVKPITAYTIVRSLINKDSITQINSRYTQLESTERMDLAQRIKLLPKRSDSILPQIINLYQKEAPVHLANQGQIPIANEPLVESNDPLNYDFSTIEENFRLPVNRAVSDKSEDIFLNSLHTLSDELKELSSFIGISPELCEENFASLLDEI